MRPPLVVEQSARTREHAGLRRHGRPLHRPAPARRLPPASVRRRHRAVEAPVPRRRQERRDGFVLVGVVDDDEEAPAPDPDGVRGR